MLRRFFAERLGLQAPVQDSKAYMVYRVQRDKEPQLNGFLKELEVGVRGGEGGGCGRRDWS